MYGYETDFQELWGDFDNYNNLRGILLRYYDDFIVYGMASFDAKGFVGIIESYENHGVISGEQEVLKFVQPYLQRNYQNRATYFAECRKETLKISGDQDLRTRVKCATPEDAIMLAELICGIEEFPVKNADEQVKRIANSIQDQAGRYYFIEEEGKVVSMVGTAQKILNQLC